MINVPLQAHEPATDLSRRSPYTFTIAYDLAISDRSNARCSSDKLKLYNSRPIRLAFIHCAYVTCLRDVLNCPSCDPHNRVVSLYTATKPQCRCWVISISNIVVSILITGVEKSLNYFKMMRLASAILVLSAMIAGNSLTQRLFCHDLSRCYNSVIQLMCIYCIDQQQ